MNDTAKTALAPPAAERHPVESVTHGDRRVDDYAWLRDPAYPELEDPRIIAYLEAENAYTEAVMAPQAALQETLFREMKARIKEDDASVPARRDAWLYYHRFAAGQQYPIHCRRGAAPEAPEQVILDVNALAAGREYASVPTVAVSPDHRLLAYAADFDGSERYTIHFAALDGGTAPAETIANTSGSVVWAEDNATVFYVERDDYQRPRTVRRHALGSDPADDPVVYHEADPIWIVEIGKTLSRAFVVVAAQNMVATEVRLIPAGRPAQPPRLLVPRSDQHEYHVEHSGDWLYILSNDTHRNFRLVRAPVDDPRQDGWTEIVAPSDHLYLVGHLALRDHLALLLREDGLAQLEIITLTDEQRRRVRFADPVYRVGALDNVDFDADFVRLSYESLVTPRSVLDCDLETLELTTRKVQEVPSGYDRDAYTSERLLATTADGAQVPISLVYRKDFAKPGPLYLYGYGSYGHGLDPYFSTNRLSLLDRGFAFALAHIRGGDELGYHWYEDGKLAHKRNTFTDFIACAEHLVQAGYTRAGSIAIAGGSAGGMLIGAVVNMRPELFRAAVAHVPFVDCLTTMLDETLPLTPIEYSEWGNPQDPAAYATIKAYSPYDNVAAQAYPHLLVTAGVSDPRVTYWEPAKWVAKLRAAKTDDNLLLLKTNMSAGHRGPSGRFASLREVALEFAFVLLAFGKSGESDATP
jgi:oligopeptidase B